MVAAACGWGATTHTTEDGPAFFLASEEFKHSKCSSLKHQILPAAISIHETNKISNAERAHLVYNFNYRLANKVSFLVKHKKFPIVLGGDHSIAIGTWAGLVNAHEMLGNFGLIWVDAHLDAHTPNTSISKSPHGMPAAFLLNQCDGLWKINNQSILKPEHLIYIGARDFEPAEQKLLNKLGVKIYYIEDVNRLGINHIMQETISYFEKHVAGFGISIDLDAFDPEYTPATGTPVTGGLDLEEFIPSLKILSQHSMLCGAEIVEFDPSFEVENKTIKAIVKLLETITFS